MRDRGRDGRGGGPARRAAVAALLALSAIGAAVPAAGAMTLPGPPPGLWMLPVGSGETPLYFDGGCNDVIVGPSPVAPVPQPGTPPAASAASCVPPVTLAPRIESGTPGTVRIRSELALASLTAVASPLRYDGPAVPAQPTVTRRDDFLWNVTFPAAMPPEFQLVVGAALPGGYVRSYVARVAAPATSVEIVRAGLRGTTVTAVVRASVPGRLNGYVTVGGRRRSPAVAVDAAAGTTRLRIRLGRRPGEALRSSGRVAVQLDPANRAPRVRAWAALAQQP